MTTIIQPLPIDHGALDDAIENGALHLRAIWRAVRDVKVNFLMAFQGCGEFALAPHRNPILTLIGDDMLTALGPNGFHERSLRRRVEASACALIAAADANPVVYEAALDTALERRCDVMIIETRPERDVEWIDYLRRHRPSVGILHHLPRPNPEEVH